MVRRSTLDLDDAVVQGLYEAAAGTTSWKVALAALDHAVGATSGSQLVVVEKATGKLVLSEQPDHTSPDGVLDYMREYHRLDPHVPYVVSRGVGEVIHTADVFPAAQYADHPFYREFWRPYNVRSFVGTKLGEDARRVAVIALMRSLDHPLYTASEVALASRYLRHLTAAVRIAQSLQRVKTSALVGHGLMENSIRPMVLLTEPRLVAAANAAARAMLSNADAFCARDGVLHTKDRDGDVKLDRALALAAAPTRGTTRPSNRVGLRLAAAHGEDILCSVWYLEPGQTLGVFGHERTWLLTITPSRAVVRVDPVFVASMFDLTPAEARVASSLVHGLRIPDIAHDLHIAAETVRSHLKSLFGKTGTRRQSDLVQRLLLAVGT